MLQTCPRCGDFYADASPPFCLADGTPLVAVDPHDEIWTEGTRVVEEKGRALRRRTRRLRLRRVMTMTMTVLVTMTVVFAAAVNTYVYVVPDTDAPVVVAAPPMPSPTPVPSETPTATPTSKRTHTEQQCTARDKQRVQDSILAASRAGWERAVENDERDRIARENLPDGAVNTSVTLPKHFKYSFTFSKTCAPLAVKATYTWTVKWGDSRKLGGGKKDVGGTKTYACRKDGAGWRCG